MRVIDFGKQIAEFDRIVDHKSVNYLWEYYKVRFKPLLNNMCSEFVKLCLKPIS